jgi:DNA-binding CsgD family transcriptional regulator
MQPNRQRRILEIDQLTPVEAKIWSMLQEGKSYQEIAETLGSQIVSVKRRMPVIREKLAIQSS